MDQKLNQIAFSTITLNYKNIPNLHELYIISLYRIIDSMIVLMHSIQMIILDNVQLNKFLAKSGNKY